MMIKYRIRGFSSFELMPFWTHGIKDWNRPFEAEDINCAYQEMAARHLLAGDHMTYVIVECNQLGEEQ